VPCVLAVDVGSSSVRAQVHGETGMPAGEEIQLGYETTEPDEIARLTLEAVEGARRDESVAAVGAACFGHSLLALDRRGRPLTPLLMWRDTRSAAHARELAARVPDLHARTGCYSHSSYWPAKLAWLRAEQREIFAGASRFVSFAEYLFERALGEPVPMSLSMASSTGLLNLRTRAWDDELAETLGVAGRLPAMSDDPLGDPPWYPALFDGFASNVGAGCAGRGRAALSVGTSGAVRALAEPRSVEPRPGLFLYWADERRVLEGGALSDGGNLSRWLRETIPETDGSVAERPPGAHGLTLLPFLAGERSPWWGDRQRGTISGLTLETTALDLRQAALEAVAYLFAEILEQLPGVEELAATGGALLHDPDWMQVMADVLERPVLESAVEEGTARGAAVVALERLGATPADAPFGRVFEPRRERAGAHRRARERLRELYAKLAG
jgi:gluconokinase